MDREKMEPLVGEFDSIAEEDPEAMGEEEEEEEPTASSEKGTPVEQAQQLLSAHKYIVISIAVVIITVVITAVSLDTTAITGIGLNHGKWSCTCHPGWTSESNATEHGQCLEPVKVDRGSNTAGCYGCNGNGVCTEEHGPLDWKSYVTIGVTMVALILMVNDGPPDLVMLGATLILLTANIISAEQAWQGFSQSGVLSVGVLFAVAHGVQEAGAVDIALRSMLGSPSSLPIALIRLLIPVAAFSAFMNNTPIVAMLIPVIESWSARIGHPKSHFMMPLSFASMLGGCCTLLGTSTNLVANAVLDSDEYDHQTLSMMELAPVGVPLTLAGILYMAFCSKFLLRPLKDGEESSTSGGKEGPGYAISFKVEAGSQVEGDELGRSGLLSLDGVQCLTITAADGQAMPAGGATEHKLQPGEVVAVKATAQGVVKLRRYRGLVPLSEDSSHAWGMHNHYLSPAPSLRGGVQPSASPDRHSPRSTAHLAALGRRRRHRRLFEAVLDQGSPLVGKVVDDEQIRQTYEAAVLAVRRGGRNRQGNSRASMDVSPRAAAASNWGVPPAGYEEASSEGPGMAPPEELQVLQRGDTLLLESTTQFQKLWGKSTHFALIREVEGSKPPRYHEAMDTFRMVLSVVTLVGMVVLAATEVVDLLSASLFATFILVASKCISMEEAFGSIKGRVLLAIITTFGVSTAMKSTGVADFTAQAIVALCKPLGARGLIAAVFLVGASVGCVVSNNATVILMLPICYSAAPQVPGVNFKQLVVTLLMAASASFLTPISYQTNLMVYAPGGYSFGSYFKFGAPLVLLMMILTTILVPILY